ncbi:MAG TPA: hypothetical protein DCS07_12420 [Bdellovibrionales bacterium]|nr:MAG: hypothetical protein A2X97_02215 [Bdellovibrionales bacterium GWA1_52_35]HAR43414.1 hypothetical protein [Bdellovibrionales bacterium]HCM39244.1 hypothetical protein [Bdellovibrionales bacterium]
MSTAPLILINSDILIPVGRSLLIGSFGISILKAIREGEGFLESFESFAIGFLALLYFKPCLIGIVELCNSLAELIPKIGNPQGLKDMVLGNLATAAQAPNPNGSSTVINIPSSLEQIWRLGVWGILSQIIDYMFLLVTYLLTAARSVFLQVVAFLFPIVAGLYPALPGLLKNTIAYSFEIALWGVVLKLIHVVTGVVAQEQIGVDGFGVPIVAVELVAVVLVLMVPGLTHRIVSGSMNGDAGGSGGAYALGRGWVLKAARYVSKAPV